MIIPSPSPPPRPPNNPKANLISPFPTRHISPFTVTGTPPPPSPPTTIQVSSHPKHLPALLSSPTAQTNRPSRPNDPPPSNGPLSACLCGPPDPEVFKILLDSGADVGFRLGVRPRIWVGERLCVDPRRGTMLEMIVAVALATAVAADGPDEAAPAWGLWVPVFDVLTC